MVTYTDYQAPLALWKGVYEEFMAQIKSTEPVTMRDRDVWFHAIDVYNAIQLGDVISTLGSYYFPFTDYSPKQRKFTNNMWTITLDENSAVIHKEFTKEGMIYNVRPGDIVEFTISPDDITTNDDWVRDASPAGIKLLNALGIRSVWVSCATEKKLRMCSPKCDITFETNDTWTDAVNEWERNNKVAQPINIRLVVAGNDIGGRLVR